jgi:hypothetical protein
VPEEDAVPQTGDTVKGYRSLSPEDIAVMNDIKEAEIALGRLWREIRENVEDADGRCLAEAKTCFQTGFMFFVKAIAKPKDVF